MYYHHIYFSFDNTKNPLREETTIIDSYIEKNCPDLTYKFWSYNDAIAFIEQHYSCFIEFFKLDTPFPIIKCDLFRYILMYHFGGVYTDLDFICIQPFDTFLKMLNQSKINYQPTHIRSPSIILSEEWLNSSSFTNTLHNGILISLKQKHPFWLNLIFEIYQSVIINKQPITCKNDVFEISGPKKLNKYYLNNIDKFSDVCILPYFYFCPYISINKDGSKVLYNYSMINKPKTDDVNWIFFNINDHSQLSELCPNSFFICIYLNTGSMWK